MQIHGYCDLRYACSLHVYRPKLSNCTNDVYFDLSKNNHFHYLRGVKLLISGGQLPSKGTNKISLIQGGKIKLLTLLSQGETKILISGGSSS